MSKVTDAISDIAEIDNKQDLLVSGTNIKTVNGTSLLGSGDISISSGVQLTTPSANQWVGLTIYTSTTNITVPNGATVMRAYAWGRGADGTTTAGGAGGGCAYGEVSVTAGQTINLDITSGVSTVSISGTTYLTANPANVYVGGTAEKHVSVNNGGAYSGGSNTSSARGGASSGSMFGTGKNASNFGGASWTYTAKSVSGAGLGDSYSSASIGGRGLPQNAILTDPLLAHFAPFSGSVVSSYEDFRGVDGGSGGGGTTCKSASAFAGKGGFGAGGGAGNGALNYVGGGDSWFGGGGGGSPDYFGGSCILGGGGGGRYGTGYSPSTGGAACIVVCWR
jgi:hypothetical protein